MKNIICFRTKLMAFTILLVFLSISLSNSILFADDEDIEMLKNRLLELEKRDIENRVLIQDLKDLLLKINEQNQRILERLANQDEIISTIPRRVPRPKESIQAEDIKPVEVEINDKNSITTEKQKDKERNTKGSSTTKSREGTPGSNSISTRREDYSNRISETGNSESTGEKKRLYDSAFKLYTITSYDSAMIKFREFIDKYPDDDLTDNAQYWIGECYLKKREYLKAVEEFQNVVEYYPLGNKVPEAYLKIGYAYLYLKDKVSAVQYFKQVVDMFPNTDASAEAERKLKEISFR